MMPISKGIEQTKPQALLKLLLSLCGCSSTRRCSSSQHDRLASAGSFPHLRGTWSHFSCGPGEMYLGAKRVMKGDEIHWWTLAPSAPPSHCQVDPTAKSECCGRRSSVRSIGVLPDGPLWSRFPPLTGLHFCEALSTVRQRPPDGPQAHLTRKQTYTEAGRAPDSAYPLRAVW